jgi:hypothetical protein
VFVFYALTVALIGASLIVVRDFALEAVLLICAAELLPGTARAGTGATTIRHGALRQVADKGMTFKARPKCIVWR